MIKKVFSVGKMNAAQTILYQNKKILHENHVVTFYTTFFRDFEVFFEISQEKRKQTLLKIRNIINALKTAGIDVSWGDENTKEERGTWIEMDLETYPNFDRIL